MAFPTTMASSSSSSSYVCDTLPVAKLAIQNPTHQNPSTVQPPVVQAATPEPAPVPGPAHSPLHPPRKLCPRHLRMADEGVNLKLQQSLDALPINEREAVNAIWSNFSYSSHPRRALILQGLLTMCCFSQLSLLSEQLAHLIRLDPFSVLPLEVSLRILGYLDATSLCRAAQVSRQWKIFADDDVLWRGICEQHIGQKCRKCGWSLPVLESKRSYRPSSSSPNPRPLALKRVTESCTDERPSKRQKSDHDLLPSSGNPQPFHHSDSHHLSPSLSRRNSPAFVKHIHPYEIDKPLTCSNPEAIPTSSSSFLLASEPAAAKTKPWKSVYSERLTVERNWRRGRCTVRTFKGHDDGVMCLQYSETLTCPSFPVLITGSYDRTVRVWNMATGAELHCLKGHTRAIRALQFDNFKLITGSMDHTIRVWDWRRGVCIRTLTGHSEGVVCLHFDSNVLATGSVDSTIKVWNLRTGGAFTLRGHTEWVNSVQLWDSDSTAPARLSSGGPLFDCLASSQHQNVAVDPGKMLFSASDDGTIRLWDLNLRTCVREFAGHMGQVQSVRVIYPDPCDDDDDDDADDDDETGSDFDTGSTSSISDAGSSSDTDSQASDSTSTPSPDMPPKACKPSIDKLIKRKAPMLMSGSLDNTIKIWDIDTGRVERTLFGHIEGVWAIASDKQRMVSGSHDRTIKVWTRDDGKCTATLVGHCAAVTCLALGEDKIVSGSDDGDVRIWNFSGEAS